MLNKLFKLEFHKTNLRNEVVGGLTTFLTMSYIVFVNPSVLSDAGMNREALITVTCLAAIVGTLLSATMANVPFAMAPGMGLNAFFTYTLVLNNGILWQTALGVVFLSSLVFILLTLTGVRDKIIKDIPHPIRVATSAGIGGFIAFIGFKNMGLIIDNPATLVGFGKASPQLALGLLGLFIIIVFDIKRWLGGMLIAIVATTGLAIALGIQLAPSELVSLPPSIAPLFMKLDVMGALKWGLIGPIFSFMFVDLFDSIGTILACSSSAGLVSEKDQSIPKASRILQADAFASMIGALLGTSTTTTFIESASGIAAGARTGLSAVVVVICFSFAMFFAPLIGAVPIYVTAPALVYVGVLMFRSVKDINLHSIDELLPTFFTIILMPLTFSISMGLSFGFVLHTLIKMLKGKYRELNITMYLITVLSVVNIIYNLY